MIRHNVHGPNEQKNKKDDKVYMPLILTQLPRTEKSKQIFNLNENSYLKIRVVAQRTNTGFMNYARSENFGHNQDKCRQTTRRGKFGKINFTKECNKPKSTKVTYANCGGPHLPNCRGFRNTLKHINKNKKKIHLTSEMESVLLKQPAAKTREQKPKSTQPTCSEIATKTIPIKITTWNSICFTNK